MGRKRERGSAMLVTMIIIIALLAGAAVVVSMQLGSSRSVDLVKTGMTATHCAEAGAAAAAPVVAANHPLWGLNLCTTRPLSTCVQPAFLDNTAFSHDLDGDGVDDFQVFITDNDDEIAPTPNNLAADVDNKLFIVSRCVKFPETPKEVQELVDFSGPGYTRVLWLQTL